MPYGGGSNLRGKDNKLINISKILYNLYNFVQDDVCCGDMPCLIEFILNEVLDILKEEEHSDDDSDDDSDDSDDSDKLKKSYMEHLSKLLKQPEELVKGLDYEDLSEEKLIEIKQSLVPLLELILLKSIEAIQWIFIRKYPTIESGFTRDKLVKDIILPENFTRDESPNLDGRIFVKCYNDNLSLYANLHTYMLERLNARFNIILLSTLNIEEIRKNANPSPLEIIYAERYQAIYSYIKQLESDMKRTLNETPALSKTTETTSHSSKTTETTPSDPLLNQNSFKQNSLNQPNESHNPLLANQSPPNSRKPKSRKPNSNYKKIMKNAMTFTPSKPNKSTPPQTTSSQNPLHSEANLLHSEANRLHSEANLLHSEANNFGTGRGIAITGVGGRKKSKRKKSKRKKSKRRHSKKNKTK